MNGVLCGTRLIAGGGGGWVWFLVQLPYPSKHHLRSRFHPRTARNQQCCVIPYEWACAKVVFVQYLHKNQTMPVFTVTRKRNRWWALSLLLMDSSQTAVTATTRGHIWVSFADFFFLKFGFFVNILQIQLLHKRIRICLARNYIDWFWWVSTVALRRTCTVCFSYLKFKIFSFRLLLNVFAGFVHTEIKGVSTN